VCFYLMTDATPQQVASEYRKVAHTMRRRPLDLDALRIRPGPNGTTRVDYDIDFAPGHVPLRAIGVLLFDDATGLIRVETDDFTSAQVKTGRCAGAGAP